MHFDLFLMDKALLKSSNAHPSESFGNLISVVPSIRPSEKAPLPSSVLPFSVSLPPLLL